MSIQHESAQTESAFLREKVEELALKTAELEEKSRVDSEAKRKLEKENDQLDRALRREEEEHDKHLAEFKKERRELENKWNKALSAKEKVYDIT